MMAKLATLKAPRSTDQKQADEPMTEGFINRNQAAVIESQKNNKHVT